jgi:hypothetical protein
MEYFLKLHHNHFLNKPFHFAIHELSQYPKLLDNILAMENIKLSTSEGFIVETVFHGAEDEVQLQCNVINKCCYGGCNTL